MDLKEFERQVLAGEITSFEPYFEDKDINYHLRYVLAKCGIDVDRIIEMDGPGVILGFIKDKVHIDRYEEWKDHPNVNIRQELARAGYFQDHYFYDPDKSVRAIAIQNNIRKALTRIRSNNDLINIRYQLETIIEPDPDILSTYIDKQKQQNRKYRYNDDNDCNLQAAQLKLNAINHIPTTIEKTMNEIQLFKSDCPLWVKPYTLRQIYKILFAQKHIQNRGYTNFTQTLFEAFHEKETVFHPESLTDLTIKLLKERNHKCHNNSKKNSFSSQPSQ